MNEDDMALVRQFAATHSEAAFAALVQRHIGLVHSAALRQTGHAHLAEEITQSVFIVLARKAASLGQATILPAWLYRATRYAAADVLKQQRRRQAREQEAYMQSTTPTGETHAAWQQLAPVLDDAMADLGERDRAAVVLRYFENRPWQEVASLLQVTEDAAQKRVTRALEKLRRRFAKRGVALTAALIAGAVASNAVLAAPADLAVKVSLMAGHDLAISTTLHAIVKSTMKTMTWLKYKLAIGVGTIVLLAIGVAAVAVSQAGGDNAMTTAEIFKKSRDTYAALTSYSDEGKSGDTMFKIKLARPDWYRIEFHDSGPPLTNYGLVWSEGSSNFVVLGNPSAQKESVASSKESALFGSGAGGISGGAALTIPATFFKMNINSPLDGNLSLQKRLADERVGGVKCYVFSSEIKEMHGVTRMVWIGQADFLIHQVRTLMSAEAVKAAWDQAEKVSGIRIKAIPQSSIATETHEKIVVNRHFSAADFAR